MGRGRLPLRLRMRYASQGADEDEIFDLAHELESRLQSAANEVFADRRLVTRRPPADEPPQAGVRHAGEKGAKPTAAKVLRRKFGLYKRRKTMSMRKRKRK